MDGEVLVDSFLLRGVMPMMKSGHDQNFFEPFRIGREIAVSPSGVKGDKHQIPQDDRLRKSKHERSEDKSADKRVVDKVRAGTRDPIQRFRRMVNSVEAPQKRYFVQSQVNKIFRNVRNHDSQEKLQEPGQASDEVLKNRNPQVFRGQGGGQ